MKTQKLHYFKTRTVDSDSIIEFVMADDFLSFIRKNDIDEVFYSLKRTEQAEFIEKFLVIKGYDFFSLSANYYHTLHDMKKGQTLDFKNGRDFYNALEGGYSKSEEYYTANKYGYKDKSMYDQSKKLGFLGMWAQVKQRFDLVYRTVKGEKCPYSDEYAFFIEYVLDQMLSSFSQFSEMLEKNFVDLSEYTLATESGFPDRETWLKGQGIGFNDYITYHKAIELGIANKQVWDKYQSIIEIMDNHNLTSLSEALFVLLFSRLKIDVACSIDTLHRMFIEEATSYDWNQVKNLAALFNPVQYLFQYIKDNMGFFCRYGTYDADNGTYTRHSEIAVQNLRVLLDGSNIAWNNKSKDDGDAPELKNIIYVYDELINRGFKKENIVIYVDGTLKHFPNIMDYFSDFKNQYEVKEAPSRSEADEFILSRLKKGDSLIVTLDSFRDWREKDTWAKDYYDSYWIKFSIDNDGEVTFSNNLDQFTV
jgi:hypothetical protein